MASKVLLLMRKYRQSILYIVFGIITTLVNYAVYYPLYNYTDLSASVINVIAWIASVSVAFLTNKGIVFGSHSWLPGTVLPEALKFAGSRLTSGLLETGIIFVTVDLLHWNGNLWKIVVSVFVVVLNYLTSKFLVFKHA